MGEWDGRKGVVGGGSKDYNIANLFRIGKAGGV